MTDNRLSKEQQEMEARADMYAQYNEEMYKPVFERNPEYYKEHALNRSIKEKQDEYSRQMKQIKDSQRSKRYIDRDIFIPLNLTESIFGRTSRIAGKTALLLSVTLTIFLILFFLTVEAVMDLTGLNILMVGAVYFLAFVLVTSQIYLKFIFKLDEKKDKRYEQGTSDKHIILGQLWGINPGGISSIITDTGKYTAVQYKSRRAIVFKILKGSVYLSNESADFSHYSALMEIDNLFLKNNFRVTKFNARYKIDNDPIWDTLDRNLVNTSFKLGSDYSTLMANVLKYHYDFTELNSKVTATYYIITPNFTLNKVDIENLIPVAHNILQSNSQSRLSPVFDNEFLDVIKTYYGLEFLDINKLNEYITENLDVLEIKTISYTTENGEVVNLQTLPVIELKSEFLIKEEDKSLIYEYNKKQELKKQKKAPKKQSNSIYGDKVI